MRAEQLLPFAMIVMSLAAASIYWCYTDDYKHVLYWISSATIIYSVTF